MAKHIILPLCAVVVVLSGCGGSSSGSTPKTPTEKAKQGFSCLTETTTATCLGSITEISDVEKAKDFLLDNNDDWTGTTDDYLEVPKPSSVWKCPADAAPYKQAECKSEMELIVKIMSVFDKTAPNAAKVRKTYLTPVVKLIQEKVYKVMQKFPSASLTGDSLVDIKALSAYLKSIVDTNLGHLLINPVDIHVKDVFRNNSGTLVVTELQACKDLNDQFLALATLGGSASTTHIVYHECWKIIDTDGCQSLLDTIKTSFEGVEVAKIAQNDVKAVMKKYISDTEVANLEARTRSVPGTFPPSRLTSPKGQEQRPAYVLTADLKDVPKMDDVGKNDVYFELQANPESENEETIIVTSKETCFDVKTGGSVHWENYPIWESNIKEYSMKFVDEDTLSKDDVIVKFDSFASIGEKVEGPEFQKEDEGGEHEGGEAGGKAKYSVKVTKVDDDDAPVQEVGVHVIVKGGQKDREYYFELHHSPLVTSGDDAANKEFEKKKNFIMLYRSPRYKSSVDGEIVIGHNAKLQQKLRSTGGNLKVEVLNTDNNGENAKSSFSKTIAYNDAGSSPDIVSGKDGVKVSAKFTESTDAASGTVWDLVIAQPLFKTLMDVGKVKMSGISGICIVLLVGVLSLGVWARFYRIHPVGRLDHQEIDLTSRLQSTSV